MLLRANLGPLVTAQAPGSLETHPSAVRENEPRTPRELYDKAVASYGRIDSYLARYVQRNPAKKEGKEEVLVFSFRKHPWSVRFKCLNGEGEGREVLYSNKPITESGIGAMIDRFGKLVEAQERGDISPGRLEILGKTRRVGYDQPLLLVRETIPPGADPDLPKGGSRLIGFHRTLHLPVLAIVHNDIGQEVDYYRFDRLETNVRLDDKDFEPNQMARRVGRTSADR
jgi:hypothetical protein